MNYYLESRSRDPCIPKHPCAFCQWAPRSPWVTHTTADVAAYSMWPLSSALTSLPPWPSWFHLGLLTLHTTHERSNHLHCVLMDKHGTVWLYACGSLLVVQWNISPACVMPQECHKRHDGCNVCCVHCSTTHLMPKDAFPLDEVLDACDIVRVRHTQMVSDNCKVPGLLWGALHT